MVLCQICAKGKVRKPLYCKGYKHQKLNFALILCQKPTIHKKKHHSKVVFRKGFKPFVCGGLYWTRTSDPIDVNDVLYQLSQQTEALQKRFIIKA